MRHGWARLDMVRRLGHVKVRLEAAWLGLAVKARSGRVRCGAAGFGGYGSVRLWTEIKAWRFGTGEAWWGMARCSMAVLAGLGCTGHGVLGHGRAVEVGFGPAGYGRFGG